MAFSSGGSVEIQVKATIGGYLSSLDKMKKAFESINPGDAFGLSIKKAIQSALTAISGLKESYQVKTAGGVDLVFNRIEDVAKSILHVNDLLQLTNAPNINLSALGEEVNLLVILATNLKNSLNVSMSDGIRDAVEASSELSDVFKSLGVNVTTMTELQGFKALEKGMKDAAKAAGEALAAYEKVNNTVTELTEKLLKLSENPLSSKEGFLSVSLQLGGINTKGFDASPIIETFRNAEKEIMSGMHRATSGHHKADFTTFMQKELLELESTITLSNAPEKIRELIGKIQLELATGANQKYTFTNRPLLDQLLNVDQMLASATSATPESLKSAMNQLTQVIDPIIENFSSAIRGKFLKLQTDAQTGNLTENGITSFLDTFIAALPTKAAELLTALEEVNNTLAKLTLELLAKLEALNLATARVDLLKGVLGEYQKIIDGLRAQLAKLQEQADNLQTQINAAVNARVGDVKRQGIEGAGDASKAYHEATSLVNMYKEAVDRARDSELMVGRIQGFVQRWFSIYSVVRMVNKAIRNVISTVKELDKTITNIAIVTDMSQSDLWALMGTYTETARKFATSISGVYEVAQLYYQLGLQSAQVTEMTEATLKLARIAGMGYADATNYMTNAVRSFKMEMSDAQRVTDVYSAISASAATSSSELAEAMSKTASSAEAVGSSFENTTAMMAVMIEATREAPQNIGSAMKSIISRYGEMTADPTATKDSEGEEMSLNRVDKALKTVGITLLTAEGLFRDFDEVIMELAEKWDTIDKNTLRYIATIMAGNRQQSRFLALVSSYDRLKELSEEAANAEDASLLQFLKTLDSVDAKTTLLLTTIKSLYTDSGFEELYKKLLDFANTYLKTFTSMAKWGKLPIPALISFSTLFLSLARVVGVGFGLIKLHYSNMLTAITAKNREETEKRKLNKNEETENVIVQDQRQLDSNLTTENTMTQQDIAASQLRGRFRSTYGKGGSAWIKGSRAGAITSMGLSMVGLGLTTGAASIDENKTEGGSSQRQTKALLNGLGKTALFAGIGLSMGGGWGALIGGIIGAGFGVAEAIGIIQESAEEKAKRLTEVAEELNNTAIEDRNKYKDLKTSLKQVRELELKRYDSLEDADAYQQAVEQLILLFPQLSAGFDSAGNALANLTNAEAELAKLREKSAESTFLAAKAQMDATKAEIEAVNLKSSALNVYKNAPFAIENLIDTQRLNNINTNPNFKQIVNANPQANAATMLITYLESAGGISLSDFEATNFTKITHPNAIPLEISDALTLVRSIRTDLTNEGLKKVKEILNNRDKYTAVFEKYETLENLLELLGSEPYVNGAEDEPYYAMPFKNSRDIKSAFDSFDNERNGKIDITQEIFDSEAYEELLSENDNLGDVTKTFMLNHAYTGDNTLYINDYIAALELALNAGELLNTYEQEILSAGAVHLDEATNLLNDTMKLYSILINPALRGTTEWYGAIKLIQDNIKTLKDKYSDNAQVSTFVTAAETWLQEEHEFFDKVIELDKLYEANAMQYLSGKLNLVLSLNKLLLTRGNYYEESTGSIAVVSNFLDKQYYEQAGGAVNAEGKYDNEILEFIEYYNKWFSSLSLTERERLEEMLSDTSNYTDADIIKELGITDEKILTAFQLYYQDGINSITGRLITQLQKRSLISNANLNSDKTLFNISEPEDTQDNVQNFIYAASQAKTVIEEQFFLSILNDYDTLIAGGYTEQGSNLLGASAALFNSYQNMTADEQKAINKIILAGDLSTISGIFDILHNLTEAGLTNGDMNNAFELLYASVVVNLSSELDSFGYAISKKVENFDKALSKASKGMGLDDAIQMADLLNLTLEDFDFKEGKFFLKDFSKVRKHYIEYFDSESEQLKKAYEDRKNILDQFNSETAIEAIIDFEDFPSWMQQGGHSGHEIKQRSEQLQLLQQLQQQWEAFWNGTITDTTELDQLFEQDFFKNALADPNLNLNATELRGVYSEYLKAVATGTNESFLEWYKKYNELWYTALSEAQQKYFDWQIASSYIAEGDIKGFVESLYGTDDQINNKKYTQQIKNILAGKGSWADLPKEILVYASTWMKTFLDSGKKIFSTITSAFGSSAIIMPETDIDKSNWEQLIGEQGKSWAKRLENGAIEIVLKTSEQINDAISDLENNPQLLERDEWLKELNTAYQESAKRSVSGVAESAFKGDTIDFESMGKFLDARYLGIQMNEQGIKNAAQAYGYVWNDVTKRFEQDITLADKAAKNWRILASGAKNDRERSLYLSLANTAETSALIKRRNAISDVVKNYTSATADLVNAVIEQFGLTLEQLNNIFKLLDDGSYKVNIDQLSKNINNFTEQFGDIIEETLGTILDTYASDLTAAASYVSKGTTKISDMKKFSKRFEELTGKNAEFNWDQDLGGFIVAAETAQEYALAYRTELIKQFGPDAIEEIDQFVAQSMMKEFIDMSSIVSFASSGDKNTETKIKKGLLAVLDSIDLFETNSIDNVLTILQAGGESAVLMALILAQLTGELLSDDDIENIAMGYINRLTSTMDSIENLEIGSFVGTNLQVNDLLKEAGFAIDSNGFITSTGDVVKAYEIFYNEIKHSNNASLETINNAYLKILEYSESNQSMAIEALSNGASMTYEALNTMLTNMGMSLEVVTKDLEKYGLKSLGAGKVRIEDWSTFSSFMGFDPNSEEYASAFNTYTQSMIELNRLTELNILDLFKNAMKASKGDLLNVSYLVTRFGKEFVEENLVKNFGALNGGILSFENDANRMQFSKNLILFAEQSGQFTDSEIAELKDEFEEAFITSLTDGITKALEGTLKRKDMVDLINVANMHGIELNEADFIRTLKGLKLSTDAAILLYNKLGGIDAIAEGITLENLIKSLSEVNELYLTLTGTLTRIQTLNKLIDDAKSKGDTTRLDQYNAELAVAKEIAKVRATTKDDSLDFMNQKMPDVLSNPLNVAKSLVGAISTWNNAWKTSTKYFDFGTGKWAKGKGMMGMDAFYNLANMMNQMAGAAGKELIMAGVTIDGSATAMGELVSKAFNTMSVLEDGSTVVNLGAIGMDFKTGTQEMTAGFEASFNQIAKDQVDMLDHMIALVETLAAVEKLGDLTGAGVTIDLNDIVKVKGGDEFTAGFEEWKKYIDEHTDVTNKDNFNQDLYNALQIQIGDQTLKDIINLNAKDWNEADAAILNGFYQAVKSGNLSEDNIWESIKQSLAAATDLQGKDLKITIPGKGETTIHIENGMVLEADKNNKWKVGGREFTNAHEAARAALLLSLGQVELTNANPKENVKGSYFGKLAIGETTILVSVDKDNKIWYYANGKRFSTQAEAVQHLFQTDKNSGYDSTKSDEENEQKLLVWEYKMHYKVAPVLTAENAGTVKLTSAQKQTIANLGDKARDTIQQEFNEAGNDADKIAELQAKYGITLKPGSQLTNETLTELLKANGIEEKTINATVNFKPGNETNKDLYKFLINGKTVSVTVNMDKVTGKYASLLLGSGPDPASLFPPKFSPINPNLPTLPSELTGNNGTNGNGDKGNGSQGTRIPVSDITLEPENVWADIEGKVTLLTNTPAEPYVPLLNLLIGVLKASHKGPPDDLSGIEIDPNEPIDSALSILLALSNVAVKLQEGVTPDNQIVLPGQITLDKTTWALIKTLSVMANQGTEIKPLTLNGRTVTISDLVTAYLKQVQVDSKGAKFTGTQIELKDGTELSIISALAAINSVIIDPELDENAFADSYDIILPDGSKITINSTEGFLLWLEGISPFSNDTFFDEYQIELPNKSKVTLQSATALLTWLGLITPDEDGVFNSEYDIDLPNGSTITVADAIAYLLTLEDLNDDQTQGAKTKYTITMPDGTKVTVDSVTAFLQAIAGVDPEDLKPGEEFTLTLPNGDKINLTSMPGFLKTLTRVKTDELGVKTYTITLPTGSTITITDTDGKLQSLLLSPPDGAHLYSLTLNPDDVVTINEVTAVVKKVILTTNNETEVDGSGINVTTTTTSSGSTEKLSTNEFVAPPELPEEVEGEGDFNALWSKLKDDTKFSLLGLDYESLMPSEAEDFTNESIESWISESLPKLLEDNGLDQEDSNIKLVATALARRGLWKFRDNSNNLLWTESVNAYLGGDSKRLLELAKQAGVNVDEGLLQGMLEEEGEVTSEASSNALELLKAIKEALSIASPSKATEEMGRYLDEGLANGIDSNNDAPISAAEQLALQIIDVFKSTLLLDGNDLFSSLLKFNINTSTSSKNTSASTGDVPEIDTEIVKDGVEEINSDVLSGVNLVTATGQGFNSTFQNLTDRFQLNAKMFNHMILLANDALGSTLFPDGLVDSKTLVQDLSSIKIDESTLENAGKAQDSLTAVSSGIDKLSQAKGSAAGAGVLAVRNSVNTLSSASFGSVASGLASIKTALANWKFPKTPVVGGEEASDAKGTIGPARAGGTATLMGELGPELYVSGGRYHIAGQNGAEFVDLPKDAIVFNHLQTKKLLETGAAGRGTAITNERNAVAFAKGTGPAMASASAVLATLKQLRSMWASLMDASLTNLAGMGGGGGGGGGSQFLKDLEKWFNLLLKIARLEKEITHELKLRSKLEADRVINGELVYLSLLREINSLRQSINYNRELLTLLRGRYEERINELLNTDPFFNSIYTFDEATGAIQLRTRDNTPADQYQPITYGGKEYEDAYAFLAEVAGKDPNTGAPKYDAKQQEAMLRAVFGNDIYEQYSMYDSSGKKTTNESERILAFFDRADSLKEEVTGLLDTILETEDNILDLLLQEAELLQKIVDNLLAVEDKVLSAIESRELAAIDEAQKERDAFSKAQEKLVEGLSTLLDKERKMYERQQAGEDLNKMRRLLAILLRSGGSQSQIRSLQDQINSASLEAYFTAQQDQIDAIKEASDLLLERMDTQIELMTETLEYLKENGLFWPEVTLIMQQTPEEIINFIQTYTPEFKSDSVTKIEESVRELNNIVRLWTGYRDDENAPDVNSNITETADDKLLMYNDWFMNTAYHQFSTYLFSDEYAGRSLLLHDAINAFYDAYNETGDLVLAQNAAARVFEQHEQRLTSELRGLRSWLDTNNNGGGTSGPPPSTEGTPTTSAIKFSFSGGLADWYGVKNGGISQVAPGTYSLPVTMDQKYTNMWSYSASSNNEKIATVAGGDYKVLKAGGGATITITFTKKDPPATNNIGTTILGEDTATDTIDIFDGEDTALLKNNKTNTSNTMLAKKDYSHRLTNLLSLLNSSTTADTPELNSLLSTWSYNTTPDSLTSLFNSASALSTLRQLQQSTGQQTTNIVNINNPVIKDEDDIQIIKDTIEDYLGSIAKKSGAYMSVR